MCMGEWFQESSPEVKKIDKITQWIGDLPASNTSKIFWGVKDLTPTERISTPRTRKIVSTPQRWLPMTTRGQRKCPVSPRCQPPIGDPRITVQPIKNTTNHSIRCTLFSSPTRREPATLMPTLSSGHTSRAQCCCCCCCCYIHDY